MNKYIKKCRTIDKVRLVIAIISFILGVLIAGTGILQVPPLSVFANSAIGFLKEVLILCGAIVEISNNSRSW